MARKYMETHVTPAVQAAQAHYYGRSQSFESGAENDPLGPDEVKFIAERDSFYLGTVTENQWPYIQHRGGPKGFLRVLGPQQIGFLDLPGNRQMLSTGALSVNDRVALFLMDYAQQERLKIMGRAKVLDAKQELEWVERLRVPGLEVQPERLFLIDVVSYDWNCPKYIIPRYSAEEVLEMVRPLQERIAELESSGSK